MTPPRDGDADFAPVIPLRRRQPDRHAAGVELTEPVAGGVWDTDTPPTDLPPRPSVWDQPAATELLVPTATIGGEVGASGRDGDATGRPRGRRSGRPARRRVAEIAVAIAVLTTAAVAIAVLTATSHPRLTHAAARTTANVPRRAVSHSTTVADAPRTNTHGDGKRAANRTAMRPRKVTRKRRTHHARATQHARHVTVQAHGAPAVVPAATGVPLATEPLITSTHSSETSPASVSPARGGAATSCVPGELGC
jgi:hypothetical protein